MSKLILYIICIPVVVYSLDGINFNALFKKGAINEKRARIFYILFVVCMSYMFVSFIYDFLGVIK